MTSAAGPSEPGSTPGTGLIRRLVVEGSSLPPRARARLYLIIFGTILLLVWGPISLMLALKPDTYTSEWTLILPGTGNGLALNLDSIGQAAANSASPYTNSSVDPVVNYKAIAQSSSVLAQAARALDMTLTEFGQPKIKLVDQTALMEFRITGRTSEQAYQKAIALNQALKHRLDQLRDDEAEQQAAASLAMLEQFNSKLEQAQQQKLSYQINADIISLNQFEELIETLEARKQHQQTMAKRQQALLQRIETLKTGLAVSESELAYALALRSDSAFQQMVSQHAAVHTQISTIDGVWGHNHPQLNQLNVAHDTVEAELIRRGRYVTQNERLTARQLVQLGTHSEHDHALIELLELTAERDGLVAEIRMEAEQIDQLQRRIETGAAQAIRLEDLNRKQQVSTAVFSTALAKQDIGNADRFSSYPLVQMLTAPSQPETPDRMMKTLALLGGIAATLGTAFGLGLLWIRKSWLRKVLKNA
ncbi:hypothetical protein [Marinobacter qingdaonensis]|uniref:Polysaccharide chain length determinant N-terminal domain-containing protein n=1 Tax=Marinobacter qingdaonensis TaxID=3108486 RepID=A0ABU5NUV3_9GAMM|nr:hypothetical protein [Marinobacter sp. ASW11-75]MEA1079584.1 hypothetical protein [Marinobacter sp. ASW11-75]